MPPAPLLRTNVMTRLRSPSIVMTLSLLQWTLAQGVMMLTPSLSMVMTLPPAVGLVARAPPLPAPTDVVTPAAATAGSGHDLLLGGRTAAGSAQVPGGACATGDANRQD